MCNRYLVSIHLLPSFHRILHPIRFLNNTKKKNLCTYFVDSDLVSCLLFLLFFFITNYKQSNAQCEIININNFEFKKRKPDCDECTKLFFQFCSNNTSKWTKKKKRKKNITKQKRKSFDIITLHFTVALCFLREKYYVCTMSNEIETEMRKWVCVCVYEMCILTT